MKHTAESFFSKEDRDRIAEAVKEAESHTSGEIVPYVVDASDAYEESEWRLGALLAAIAIVVLLLIHLLTSWWLPFTVAEWVLGITLCFLAGMLLAKFVPGIRRACAGRKTMDRRVAQRAAEAFIAEEVFLTRDRTGVLLFISLLEHKVHVLGDAGINKKVQPADWQAVADAVVEGIVAGRPTDGVIAAIRKIGALLEKSGVAIKPDDRDEISDNLRLGRP
jgi:putative membrane protein